MLIPEGEKALSSWAKEIIDICRVSIGTRAAAYSQYARWIETGGNDGGLALANLLFSHIDRLSSYLYSPTDLRFLIDFETHYPEDITRQGEMAARVVTREWERKNIDMVFGDGVKESLSYGACLLKQLVSGEDGVPDVTARLVPPWNFGVYNEQVNALADQEAVVETAYLNKHEVWRRIAHLPGAEQKYRTILSAGAKNEGAGMPGGFFHNVLSTATLDVSGTRGPTPGGVVSLGMPTVPQLGPQVGADLYPLHELWVKDDDTGDHVTIQMFEPDILIAGQFKKANLFCPDTLPYTLIQPNTVAGYFFGRSEIVDLIMLQSLLTNVLNDGKRVMGQQFERLLAFPGADTITDEVYGQFRANGYIGLPPGAQVSDLTPKMPENFITFVAMIEQMMDKVSGFTNILSGQGESGVRAGSHAETLTRNSSPRLRDRALRIERQCASAGDVTLSVLEAKNAKAYWTDPESQENDDFLLSQLPENRRISVDSHSSSPIYQDDHMSLIGFALKGKLIGGDTAIEMLPFPSKDLLISRWRKMQAAEKKFLEEHPELLKHGHSRGSHTGGF